MAREWIFGVNLFLCVLLVLTSSGCVASQEPANRNANVPVTKEQIPLTPGRVVAISAGINHNLAVMENGTVKAWGSPGAGSGIVPKNLTNVTAVAAGEGFSIAVKKDGTVIAWGCNWDLRIPRYRISNDTKCGENCPCNIPADLTRVKTISASRYHVLALREDGTVVAWGRNNEGQCAIPFGLKNVTAISAGDTFSMALMEDGTVAAWGDYRGRVPHDARHFIAIAAGYDQGLLLKDDGTIAVFTGAKDNHGFGNQVWHPPLTNVTAISVGYPYFMALLSNGSVVQWGYTVSVNLDHMPPHVESMEKVRENLTHITAISSQVFHNLALREDGAVVEWRY